MFDQSTGFLASLARSKVRNRLSLIHNPTSGQRNRQRLQSFLGALGKCGMRVALHATGERGHASALARNASARDSDVLAIAGGDGTINEVINGVADRSLPIALLPLGTANVLAAELGLPRDPDRLARVIARGKTAEAFVPTANRRRFIMMVGAGFDAYVVATVQPRLKRVFGRLAYVVAFGRALFRFPYRRYQVSIDGTRYEAASVIVANGRCYGGRFTCAPDARIDDPDLHVCLFLRSGPWSALRYGTALVLGTLDRRSDVAIMRGRHVEVLGEPGEAVQCDGDLGLTLPLCIDAGSDTLRFIVAADG